MAIQDLGTRRAYLGNGTAIQFPTVFRIFSADELDVWIDGVLLILSSDYTVSGIDTPSGTVTFASVPPVGAKILILRDTKEERLIDYQNQGDFREKVVNKDYDRIWAKIQEMQDELDRSIRLSDQDFGTYNLTIPVPHTDRLLEFDMSGNLALSNISAGLLDSVVANAAGQFTGLNGLQWVSSIGAIRQLPAPLATGIIATTGYSSANDGGDGVFIWNGTSTAADNAGTVLKPNSIVSGPGRWIRQIENDSMSIIAWGAVGDNVFDNQPVFQRVIEWAKVSGSEIFIPAGNFRVKRTIQWIVPDWARGPRIRGTGEQSTIMFGFANGTPCFKFRVNFRNHFFTGGYLKDFNIDGHSAPGEAAYGYLSQGACIDFTNWWLYTFENVYMNQCNAAAGFHSPKRNLSVHLPDRTNDKPYVYILNQDASLGRQGNMAQVQAQVNATTGAITGFTVIRPGYGYSLPTVKVVGPGTGFVGTVQVNGLGEVTGVTVINGGSGYLEDNELLYDNQDAYTVGMAVISKCKIQYLDGWGMIFPHFASGQMEIVNNIIQACWSGGAIFGGNHNVIEKNAISLNGMPPAGPGKLGLGPGIWLRRDPSSPETCKISQNELDSNALCHILLDGTSKVTIERNRFNSWMTVYTYNTDWLHQIPNAQVKFENNAAGGQNVGIQCFGNSHRVQPGESLFVGTATAQTVAGNNLIHYDPASTVNGQGFIQGGKIRIYSGGSFVGGTLTGGTPITFSNSLDYTFADIVNVPGGTMTLRDSPNVTLSSACYVRVVLEEQPCVWYDLGKDGNTGDIHILSPIPSGGVADELNIRWANVPRTKTSTRISFDYSSKQVFTIPPNNFARLTHGGSAPAITIPSGLVLQDIALSTRDHDPLNMLQLASGVPTGHYLLPARAMIEINGRLAFQAPTAGKYIELCAVTHRTSIDETGAHITSDVIGSTARHYFTVVDGTITTCEVPFTLFANVTDLQTYVGENHPKIAQLGASDAGLLWWDPIGKVMKYWNGGGFQIIPGWNTYFAPSLSVRLQCRQNDSNDLTIYQYSSSHNWISFKQV